MDANDVEEDRRANQDPIQNNWNNLVRTLIVCMADENADESIRFRDVLRTIAKFIQVCVEKKGEHNAAERAQLFERLAQGLWVAPPEKIDHSGFFTALDTFVRGTQDQCEFLRRDDDGEYFVRLATWLPDILQFAIPAYDRNPEPRKRNTTTAAEYCAYYRQTQSQRFRTVMLVGAAIGIYVELLSLEKTELGNLKLLKKEQAYEIRSAALSARLNELKSVLHKARQLTPELEAKFEDEEKKLIAFLKVDPYTEELPFTILKEIDGIITTMLRGLKADILTDFMEDGAIVPNPDEPLCDLLRRDYFPDLVDIEHPLATARALRQIDNAFRHALILEYNILLGDRNVLTDQSLQQLLSNYLIHEQFDVLERMFKAILENENKRYASPTQQNMFQKPDAYSALQYNHIRILQDVYIDILRTYQNDLAEALISESSLLKFDARKNKRKDATAQQRALQVIREPAENRRNAGPFKTIEKK